MEDIAIQYEKIMINDYWFLFRPVSVVKGNYIAKEEIFKTNYGTILEFINGSFLNDASYFGNLITLDELKKQYGDIDESSLFSKYFHLSNEKLIMGYYGEDKIETLKIPFDLAEKFIDEDVNDFFEENSKFSTKIFFTVEALKNLRNLESIEAVRNWLDDILRVTELSQSDIYYENNTNIHDETASNKYKEKVSTKKLSLKKEESKKFNLIKLKKTVLSNIIGQDDAVNAVTTAIVVNNNSNNPRHKSHILIAGPSGTGKTEMVNIITKELGLPCFKADATAYTKEGYVGKSVYSMLWGLIDAADGDIEKAQNGVLIVDEIDKKASNNTYNDVSGSSVLNSMLKMMDRGIIELDNQSHFDDSTISFDTSNLTIIFMGAFTGIIDNKEKTKTIGFENENKNKSIYTKEITEQDFIDYGVPSEFMGRIPILASTQKLSLDNLIKILKQSKISPLKIEKEYFKDLGIELTYTSDYINRVAKEAEKSKFGARELSKIVRKSLIDIYAETLLDKKISEIKITEKTIDNPKIYCKKYNKK